LKKHVRSAIASTWTLPLPFYNSRFTLKADSRQT